MKNKIRHAFEQDTPDIWAGICYNCALQTAPQSASASKIVHYREPKPNFLADALQIAAIAAVFVLIVGGSIGLFGLRQNHHGGPSLGTNPPTPGITTQPTTQPTHPTETDPIQPPTTEPSPPPSTEPTVPPVDPLQLDMDIRAYCTPESNRYMFYRYDGILLPMKDAKTPDVSQCAEDYFYIFDYVDGIAYFVAEQVLEWDYTCEHLYYVSEEEPTKIYRMDLEGKNRTLVYESESGSVITHIQYDGKDANGVLLFAQNNNEILSYDLKTGETKKLLEAYYIESFIYRHSSCSEPWVKLHMGATERGEMLYLEGQYDELDTRPRESYLYFFETGEFYARRHGFLGLNNGYGYKYVEYTHEEPTFTDQYSFDSSPSYLLVRPYHKEDQYLFDRRELIDTSECVEGWLYSFNEATGEIVLLFAEPVLKSETDYEYVYYVTQSEPNTIRYSTFDGMKAGILYTGGEITSLQACGYQARLIAFIEDKSVFKVLDWDTGTNETVYTHSEANVENAYFSSSYIEDENRGIVTAVEFYPDDGRIFIYDIEKKELREFHDCED